MYESMLSYIYTLCLPYVGEVLKQRKFLRKWGESLISNSYGRHAVYLKITQVGPTINLHFQFNRAIYYSRNMRNGNLKFRL